MNIIILKNYWFICVSFIFWMMVSIIPLGTYWVIIRPEFIVLSLIYWAIFVPGLVGIIFAFILGIFWDLLLGSPLGASSLSLCLIVYLVNFLRPKLVSSCLWQQALTIFSLVASYKLILLWANLFNTSISVPISYWLSILTSIIAWPLVYIATQYYQSITAIR